MNRKTTASLFTGGGGYEIGAMMAGFTPTWGVEIRPDIAAVAEANIPGLRVIVSDVAAMDYSTLERPDHLHASPSCKNASNASDGEEAPEDLSSAGAICRAIEALKPDSFTLENVWAYRNFESFKMIVSTLTRLGYKVDWWHLNSADYGVPQTRKRLILIARLDRQPTRPTPTHSKTPDMFGLYKPWVGWYEAILDLIPTLPDSEFAPWQIARLPAELKTLLLSQGSYDGEVVNRDESDPAFTVTANSNQGGVRAFLMRAENANQAGRREGRYQEELAVTIGANPAYPRAYLAPVNGESSTGFEGNEPAQTVAANHGAGKYRAVIIPGDNSGNDTMREANEPMNTIQTRPLTRCPHRAFVVGSQYGQPSDVQDRPPQTRSEGEPYFTVTSSAGAKSDQRAAVAGRVVKMTPRCLARFQSFPDDYTLPDANGLACEVIGNAVPPLLAKAICESLD